MRLLAIAAAGFNLSNSPAMLIIRQGGRVGCALAAAYCSDGCIAKRSANRKQLPSFLQNLVAGQVSPQKYAAHRGVLLRTRGDHG